MKLLRLPIVIVLTYAFILMGCGQKGPLYLPEKQSAPIISSEPTQNSGANSQTSTTTQPIDDQQTSSENTNEAAQ